MQAAAYISPYLPISPHVSLYISPCLARVQAAANEQALANTALRTEIESLRHEAQVFEAKLQALQAQTADLAWSSVLASELRRTAAT